MTRLHKNNLPIIKLSLLESGSSNKKKRKFIIIHNLIINIKNAYFIMNYDYNRSSIIDHRSSIKI